MDKFCIQLFIHPTAYSDMAPIIDAAVGRDITVTKGIADRDWVAPEYNLPWDYAVTVDFHYPAEGPHIVDNRRYLSMLCSLLVHHWPTYVYVLDKDEESDS